MAQSWSTGGIGSACAGGSAIRALPRAARVTVSRTRRRDFIEHSQIGRGTHRAARSLRLERQNGPCGGNRGADDEIRTRDIDLGKVALYQLSYIRVQAVVHLRASIVSDL